MHPKLETLALILAIFCVLTMAPDLLTWWFGNRKKRPQKRCRTCRHWFDHQACDEIQDAWPYYADYGRCDCPKLTDDPFPRLEAGDDSLIYDYSEGGGFSTGPDFGCVHWKGKQSDT